MGALETALEYFKLSNERRLNEISALFQEDATYSSDNTGLYFGKAAIMNMMTPFFAKFPYLHWEIHESKALDDYICEIIFTLQATDAAGQEIVRPGIERIVAQNGKIRYIEIRNR